MNQSPSDLEKLAAELRPPQGWMPQSLDRAVQILRHYRWTKLARRGLRTIARRFGGPRKIAVPPCDSVPRRRSEMHQLASVADVYLRWRKEADSKPTIDFDTGRITLLNESRVLGWPLNWNHPSLKSAAHLWLFQLHYHEYLLSCAYQAPVDVRSQIWQTVHSWIHEFKADAVNESDDSWHPYCISRRLPAWIWLLQTAEPDSDEPKILGSIRDQAVYLASHLEFDPGGNHLLENLTALGLAGLFLDGAEADGWLQIVESHLRRELPRQILTHGEHFERSPMYHCQVAANLLSLSIAATCRPTLQELCRERVAPMLNFIVQILHPDGEIPLFGDSVFDEAPGTKQLRELAALARITWPSSTGTSNVGPYWIYRHDQSALIFDGGQVGAAELPAHAHADALNLEVSIGGRRWFVDSGTYDYADSPMRHYCRSSVAHNVAILDGHETCDVWSKFRMGRRPNVRSKDTDRHESWEFASAEHNAYRARGVLGIGRIVAGCQQSLFCADIVYGRPDSSFQGFVHLMPDLRVVQQSEFCFALSDGISTRQIEFLRVEKVDLMESWYCPRFGQRIRNACFAYRNSRGQSDPFILMGWIVSDPNVRQSSPFNESRYLVEYATQRFARSSE